MPRNWILPSPHQRLTPDPIQNTNNVLHPISPFTLRKFNFSDDHATKNRLRHGHQSPVGAISWQGLVLYTTITIRYRRSVIVCASLNVAGEVLFDEHGFDLAALVGYHGAIHGTDWVVCIEDMSLSDSRTGCLSSHDNWYKFVVEEVLKLISMAAGSISLS
jgi:hypothetical protein